tara:strand:- start:686 stop:835 length:150 start_codon:yes stop_codon:yes gene_type:complete
MLIAGVAFGFLIGYTLGYSSGFGAAFEFGLEQAEKYGILDRELIAKIIR